MLFLKSGKKLRAACQCFYVTDNPSKSTLYDRETVAHSTEIRVTHTQLHCDSIIRAVNKELLKGLIIFTINSCSYGKRKVGQCHSYNGNTRHVRFHHNIGNPNEARYHH
jgi:hypothetical protein